MMHQHHLEQGAPKSARYPQVQAMPSAIPPYHTAAATPEGRRNVREAAEMINRAQNNLRPEEVYFFNHDEQDHAFQEEPQYHVLASSSGIAHLAESHAPICACGPECKCKPACKYQIHDCPCAPCGNENVPESCSSEAARSTSQKVSTDRTRQLEAKDIDKAQASGSFGDGSLPKQKSQSARVVRRKEINVDTTTSGEPLHLRRQRAPTINSDLAYVPPPAAKKTPSRKKKDTTPLGFYSTNGSHSGQRYPTFKIGAALNKGSIPTLPDFAAGPNTSDQIQSLEPLAQTLLQLSSTSQAYKTQAVEPLTLSTLRLDSSAADEDEDDSDSDGRTPSPLSAPRQRKHQCNKTYAAITGEDVESYSNVDEYHQLSPIGSDDQPEVSSNTVTYPAIPRSTSAGLFNEGVYTPTPTYTQSFPSAQAGNPRDPEGSPDQAGVHRQDWFGHGDNKHIAGYESVPTQHPSPANSGKGFAPPLPAPLPLPDFIAPKPATKQRYVSAGGNAKLEDRPEITDFQLPPSVTPGISMQRDLLLQRLEQVPQFGTTTRSLTIGSPVLIRGSEEALRTSSTRTSYEDGLDITGTKRDRKESNSSQRIARFKRVFSFGKDGKERDSKERDSKEISPKK